jgi:hypothetical protein
MATFLLLATGALATTALVPRAPIPPPGMHNAPASEVSVAQGDGVSPSCHLMDTPLTLVMLGSPDEATDVGTALREAGFVGTLDSSTVSTIVQREVAQGATEIHPPNPATFEWAETITHACS